MERPATAGFYLSSEYSTSERGSQWVLWAFISDEQKWVLAFSELQSHELKRCFWKYPATDVLLQQKWRKTYFVAVWFVAVLSVD